MEKTYRICPTPLGGLVIAAADEALTHVVFDGAPEGYRLGGTPVLREAEEQLKAYFAGLLTAFDLPLAPAGTPFQLAVWRELESIPYGETRSYGQVAAAIGKPGAARAVGMANHRNPISIIIPCHRVIGADGSMTGYGGGLDKKILLLELERSVCGKQQPTV